MYSLWSKFLFVSFVDGACTGRVSGSGKLSQSELNQVNKIEVLCGLDRPDRYEIQG